MDAEDVSRLVELANDLVSDKNKPELNNLQKELLQGVLAGEKYKDIKADPTKALHHYPVEYLGKSVAYGLWKLLTEVLREVGVLSEHEKVNRHNVKEYLQRVINQQSQLTDVSFYQFLEPAENIISCELILQPNNQEICWVGRETLIAELHQKLLGDCRILSLVGITGIGKTALAGRLTLEPAIAQTFPVVKKVDFDIELPSFDVVARCVLGDELAADEVLVQNSERLISVMVGKLRSHPCLLVLDMMEEVLEIDNNGTHQFKEEIFSQFFKQFLKTNIMSSRIIITSQYQLPVIAEGRYLERIYNVLLKGLEKPEALEFFNSSKVRIKTEGDLAYLSRLSDVYEGHPLALRVIAGEILEPPYNGDIQAYWHDYGHEIETVERLKNEPELSSREDKPTLDRYSIKLADLVRTRVERTFVRLLKSTPLACLLLCMGAKYRRAVERRAWLFLIDEYSEEASLIAWQTLQRRFLIEEEYTPHKVLYRLHSLIRRVALDNLLKIEEEIESIMFLHQEQTPP